VRAQVEAEQRYGRIAELVTRPLALMEVCGTHTMAISKAGLRSRVPRPLRLLSGPGCPVCVTPREQIDQAIAMAREPGVVVASFGDMLRVPGATSSLERERAAGARVQIVYSPVDALALAQDIPDQLVVFIGVGFETTSPTVAATLVRAAEAAVDNFYVLPAFKLVPPAMAALLAGGGARIDGFICPGHVTAIIGSAAYRPLCDQHHIPCVVTGFEVLDILDGVTMLLEQIATGRAAVEVQYRRAVTDAGNTTARALLERVFRVCDSSWRGIGTIPGSGLELAPEFERFDARRRIPVEVAPAPGFDRGCACGEVMRGLLLPPDCPLFGQACVPAHPVGPCMVSSEGACAAYHRYGG